MAHILNNEFYKDGWGTEEMRNVFLDRKRYQRWLDIEAALAETQAELGIIPVEAAEEIARCADVDKIDLDFVKSEIAATSHSLVPLLRAVALICKDDLGEYIHYGPTTQDIQDTATVLEMMDACHIIYRDLIRLEEAVLVHADRYKDYPMAGRTHNQQGLPITLGLKFAGWGAEIRRNIERMKDMSKRIFIIMLHGGTGTQAAFGEHALEIVDRVASKLNLDVPPTGWGNSRDTVAEYQVMLGMIGGTVGRIANEIFQLSRTEIGELHEPLGKNYVGSSTMPHKRNAEVTEFVVLLCKIVGNNANLALGGMVSEHERDTRVWRLDWHSIPESSIMLGKALDAMINIVSELDIQEKMIDKNLDMLHGMLFSEALMFHIGEKVGKQTAHKLIHGAIMKSIDKNLPFKTTIINDENIKNVITEDELNNIMDYSKHIGKSVNLVENTIKLKNKLKKNDHEYYGISIQLRL